MRLHRFPSFEKLVIKVLMIYMGTWELHHPDKRGAPETENGQMSKFTITLKWACKQKFMKVYLSIWEICVNVLLLLSSVEMLNNCEQSMLVQRVYPLEKGKLSAGDSYLVTGGKQKPKIS